MCVIPTEQLREIAKVISAEIKKRKKESKKHDARTEQIYTFDPVVQKKKGIIPSIPDVAKMKNKMAYMESVLGQDWDYLFDDYKNENNKFYVYIHKDPRVKMPHNKVITKMQGYVPFYVGKGTGDRFKDLKRNQGHGKRIKEIINAGFPGDTIPVKIITDIGEKDALVFESKLIYLFKTLYESRHGILVNLDIGRRPLFDSELPLISKRNVIIRRYGT